MACCGKKDRRPRKIKPPILHLKAKKAKMVQIQSAPMARFVMCQPTHYGVLYSINPWMDVNNGPNRNLATEQWQGLRDRLVEYGAEIVYIKPFPETPDMVFTANAGFVLPDNKFVLSRFRYEERRPEEPWFLQFFADRGYTFFQPETPFEGSGDVLQLGGMLICGHGFRSELGSYATLARNGLIGAYLPVRLTDQRFYHLDTCFCPLAGLDYLIYPGAIDPGDLAKLRQLGAEIAVPTSEALRFACNAVCVNRTVIMPSGCPATEAMLRQAGYTPVPTDMSEFIKSGGACKCLTLAL